MLSTLVLADHAAHYGHHFGGPFGGGFGFLFLLIPLLFWVGVFALIFTFGRRRRREWAAQGYRPGFGGGPWGHPGAGGSHSAEATLAERFAQGDIEEVEYRARLEVLRANGFPQPPAK